MAVCMYLVQPKDRENDEARASIAEFIASRKGYILMATSYGSLIVAFDEQHQDAVRRHPLVEFIGGVRLDPQAPGAAALQQMFAQNLATQVAERRGPESSFPPGYRPLRRPGREG